MNLARAKELAVLSALAAHDGYGYAIAAELEKSFGPFLGIGRAAIYAILARFEERGWVTSRTAKAAAYPERQIYRITKAGRAAVGELRSEAEAGAPPPVSALVALLMASEASGETVDAGSLIAERKAWLADLDAVASAGHAESDALRLCRRLVEAELKVLRSLR